MITPYEQQLGEKITAYFDGSILKIYTRDQMITITDHETFKKLKLFLEYISGD